MKRATFALQLGRPYRQCSDLDMAHIVNPLRKLLSHVQSFHGEVERIDLISKTVTSVQSAMVMSLNTTISSSLGIDDEFLRPAGA